MTKFSISGAHGTGKTTLVNTISQQYQRLGVVPEVPRAICTEWNDPEYFHRDRNSFAKQTLLIARQIAAEAVAGKDLDTIVTDRCVADHWAYTQEQFPAECSEEAGALWKTLVYSWMSTYDLVFLACLDMPLENDGVRETDIEFRQTIDHRIRTLLGDIGTPTIALQGSTEQRIRTFTLAASLDKEGGTIKE